MITLHGIRRSKRPAHALNTQAYAKANKARVEAVREGLREEVWKRDAEKFSKGADNG